MNDCLLCCDKDESYSKVFTVMEIDGYNERYNS